MVLTKRNFQAGLTLLFDPAKAYNYGKYVLTAGRKPLTLPFAPHALDIEPTTYCNFKCKMCQVSTPGFQHRHMEFELFKKIIDENPQLVKIKLQGMGEPLLCPDVFKMIEYANARRILVQTTSNGSCFNDKFIENALKVKLTSIAISMDGATKEVFEGIRIGSNFDRVVSGVRALIQRVKAERKSVEIRAWTVLQNDNIGQATDIVRLCHDMGFKRMVFQPFLSGWGKEDWKATNDKFRVDFPEDDYAAKIKQAITTAKALGFPVRIHTGDIYSFDRLCIWPWHSAFINADGEVVPCCIVADAKVKTFGSVKNARLSEIWNNAAYQEFRREHREKKIPGFCKQCYKEFQN